MSKAKLINSIVIIFIVLFFMWQGPKTRPLKKKAPENKKKQELKVATKTVKHNIPLNEILDGGPSKDGIPSIDNPKFVPINKASNFLEDSEMGIAIEVNAVHRFYPFQILVWHEIVNDIIAGRRILITYCPLCYSGIVFDPIVNGEQVEFGTSGKLWKSNLLMYDRKTGSLWSQILGKAVLGDMTGTKLKLFPSNIIPFGKWKKLYAKGEVLSRNTGVERHYGYDPYESYYTTPGTYFPVGKKDNRLDEKSLVLGIIVDGKAKAYPYNTVKKRGRIEDLFAGHTVTIEYMKKLDLIQIHKEGEKLNPFIGFWFSWAAVHPGTKLYK